MELSATWCELYLHTHDKSTAYGIHIVPEAHQVMISPEVIMSEGVWQHLH
jgi:hypothetical protein